MKSLVRAVGPGAGRAAAAGARRVTSWQSAPLGLADRVFAPPSWQAPQPHHGGGFGHAHGHAAQPHAPHAPHGSLSIPYVVESTPRGERGYDIFSRLLVERIVCVHGAIDDGTASLVVAQLLYLDSLSQEAPVHMYINSPGGLVTAGLAIYDTMQFVRAPVSTLCVGQACSMASLLVAAGSPGLRRSLPNARIMVHQPHGGVSGQASDIQIHTQEMLQLKVRCRRRQPRSAARRPATTQPPRAPLPPLRASLAPTSHTH